MENTGNNTVAQVGKIAYDAPEPIWVEEDSPLRCQYSSINQCRYSKVEGQQYCKYHLPVRNAAFRTQQRVKKYKLVQLYARVEEFASNPELKNLSEEIAILSNTLEVILSQCHTPFDVMINQTRIESLVDKVARVTQINQRVQAQIGKALDEVTLAFLMDAVAKAIIDENLPEEQLIRISNKIGDAVSKSKTMASETAMKDKYQ